MSALTTGEIQKRDRAFSLAVRARAGGRCQRCGVASGLHCAHIVGRSRWRTRWHPDNGVALCWRCHRWAHDRPLAAREWFASLLGPERWQALLELRRPMKRSEVVGVEQVTMSLEDDAQALAVSGSGVYGRQGGERSQLPSAPVVEDGW